VRLAYLDPKIQPLFSRPSPELLEQRFSGNQFFVVRELGDVSPKSPPFYFSSLICDYHCLAVEAKHIPFRLRSTLTKKKGQPEVELVTVDTPRTANLSPTARAYLAGLGIPNPDLTGLQDLSGLQPYELVWLHALAIGYSPVYLSENADGIKQDWPHVPLPKGKDELIASAALGKQVAALLDTEGHVAGVIMGKIRPELKPIAVISREGGGALKPEELAVTVGWGHAGKGGVTMPGKGKLVIRDYTPEERAAIEEGAQALSLSAREAFVRLGKKACDVYLNDAAYWKNVPAKVWEYTIGGYQVVKKWLSYREQDLLGRALTADEAREVTNMARRIAAVLLLEPALDANYKAVKKAAYAWPASSA